MLRRCGHAAGSMRRHRLRVRLGRLFVPGATSVADAHAHTEVSRAQRYHHGHQDQDHADDPGFLQRGAIGPSHQLQRQYRECDCVPTRDQDDARGGLRCEDEVKGPDKYHGWHDQRKPYLNRL